MTLNYFIPVSDDAVKLDTSEASQLVSDSNRRWHDWTDMTQSIRNRALEAMQLYLENRPDGEDYNKPDDTGRSRVRRPILAEAVDSIVAQQHLSAFPGEERFFKVQPRNKAATDSKTSYEKHTETRLSLIDFMINHYRHRVNKVLTGVSAVWHPYFYEEEERTNYRFPTFKDTNPLIAALIPKIADMRAPGKAIDEKSTQKTLQFTSFIPLHLEDWRVDPTMDNLKEANFIWRRWMPVDQLKAVKGLKNKDEITSYHGTWDDSDSKKSTTYQYMGITQTWDDMDSSLCEQVLLYEEWGDFYIDGEYYPNHVLLYSNDSLYHGLFPNPYNHQRKPFTVSPYIPLPGTLYGKSAVQDSIPLCHAEDSMINQELDAFGIVANTPFTYLVTDEALVEYFKDGPVSLRPGEGIPVSAHDSIKPIQWPVDALTISEGAQQRIKEEIRESTGGVPYATGGTSEMDTQRTATEVNTLSTGTNTRFQLLVQMDEEQVAKPYLEMIYENDRQFMDEEVFVDDEPEPLMPDTVKMMDLRFDVTGSRSIANRSKEIQEVDTIIAALPGWIKSGLVQPNGDILIANVPEILKRRVALNSSFRDLENVMEVLTMEEQQQQQEAEMNLGAINGPVNVQGQIDPGGAPPGMAGVPGNAGMAAPQANVPPGAI